ncbi:MAG: apolipoprotein N-acyltransferase [Pirellulaceae bacterium]|nr:apolipoprotein N-acyltransferase [Pirellulaceae bacterium]
MPLATVNPRSRDPSRVRGEARRCPEPRFPSPLAWSLFSGVLLWASFPPLGWWPLAWIAPVGWLFLIRCDRLPGRRPYRSLALGGFLHWLAVLQGIRLAHPALYVGWFALAAYLAVYPVLFVLLSRVAVQRGRLSIIVAAPIVWTGLEWVRGHAITGFSLALLGHTQASWITLLQLADVFGAYGVSFVVMLVAAALARMLPLATEVGASPVPRWTWWPVIPASLVLASAIAYGTSQQRHADRSTPSRQALRVALIQGSFDTIFEFNPQRDRDVFLRYRQLSEQAVAQHPGVQLVVWPESMFSGDLGEILIDGPIEVPPDMPLNPDEYRLRVRSRAEAFGYKVEDVARRLNAGRRQPAAEGDAGIHLIVGTDTLQLAAGGMRRYNAALCVSPAGQVTGRYYKMHRVMFGEYIPCGDLFPWLYRLTPMKQGLDPGKNPECFRVAGWRLSPSICFESTVPHLIRRQVDALGRSEMSPDILVNVTNDGWFWGASILDLHLACAVCRAIENRLPMLVAANTGISAVIDSRGRVLDHGPRRGEAILYAEIQSDDRQSWYQRLGDIPAVLCALFCLVAAIVAMSGRRWNKSG